MGSDNSTISVLNENETKNYCLQNRFVSQNNIEIVLREKMFSWSGDDFTVKDTQGFLKMIFRARLVQD